MTLDRRLKILVMAGWLAGVAFVKAGEDATARQPAAAPEKPVKIAIIAGVGDRAPEAGVADLLTAELSKDGDLVLLEREQVGKVLAEQELNAAGFVNPATIIKLGKLLAAESCLFVDRIPGTNQSALSFRFVETRTGVVLGHLLAPESNLDSSARELRDLAVSVSAKLRMPLDRRHYVGILGFRSQEIREDLDSLAQALEMLVADELHRSPSIVVLDREHLDALIRETTLTEIELALRASSILLEGVVGRGGSETTAVVRLILKPLLPGAAASEILVRIPKDDILGARKAVCGAVFGSLPAAALPAERSGGESEEPRRFFVRASFLAAHGERQAALRNAAAAYTLDPAQGHLSLLASLSQRLRAKRLWVQYWKNEVRRLCEQGHPVTLPEAFAFPVQPLPASGEALEQAAERVEDIRLEREILRLKLAYHSAGLDQFKTEWWATLGLNTLCRILSYWSRNNEEWERYMRDLLELYVHPPPAVRNTKRMAFELRLLWFLHSNTELTILAIFALLKSQLEFPLFHPT